MRALRILVGLPLLFEDLAERNRATLLKTVIFIAISIVLKWVMIAMNLLAAPTFPLTSSSGIHLLFALGIALTYSASWQ